MPFGLRTVVGPRNHALDWSSYRHEKGQFWGKGEPIVKYRDILPWTVQKWLNRSVCRLVVDSAGPKEAQVQSYSPGGASVPSHEGTLAPPGEYDWTVRLLGRCGLMSNYFDRLFFSGIYIYHYFMVDKYFQILLSGIFASKLSYWVNRYLKSVVFYSHILHKTGKSQPYAPAARHNYISYTGWAKRRGHVWLHFFTMPELIFTIVSQYFNAVLFWTHLFILLTLYGSNL